MKARVTEWGSGVGRKEEERRNGRKGERGEGRQRWGEEGRRRGRGEIDLPTTDSLLTRPEQQDYIEDARQKPGTRNSLIDGRNTRT